MLMMLGRFGAWENAIAADAHDAGAVWGFGKTPLQLMLMMLGRSGAWENAIAADAHDAGAVWGLGERLCS